MKRRGSEPTALANVHACRYGARNKGGTHGPMQRMRGRNSSRPHLHGVALHDRKNASLGQNLTEGDYRLSIPGPSSVFAPYR